MAMDESKALTAIKNAAQVIKTKVQVGKQLVQLIKDVKQTVQQSSKMLIKLQVEIMARIRVYENLLQTLQQLAQQIQGIAFQEFKKISAEQVQKHVSAEIPERAADAIRGVRRFLRDNVLR